MKKLLIIGSAAVLSLAAAPASAQSANHILRGAGIGAAGGVVAGAIIPGLSVGQGALIGGAGGVLYNTLINKERRTYRSRSYRSSSSGKHRVYQAAPVNSPRYRSYRAN